MMGRGGMFRVVVLALVLAACVDGAEVGPVPPRVTQALQQIFPDPAMSEFFATEAKAAKVAEIMLVRGGNDYGSTSFDTDTRQSVIRINVAKSGSKSPTNLAHEIAHAAIFRQGCFNHGARWLSYHMAIAQRFEARFPGVAWSGRRPTENVAAKAARYPNDRC